MFKFRLPKQPPRVIFEVTRQDVDNFRFSPMKRFNTADNFFNVNSHVIMNVEKGNFLLVEFAFFKYILRLRNFLLL